jgi:hypothetical protein
MKILYPIKKSVSLLFLLLGLTLSFNAFSGVIYIEPDPQFVCGDDSTTYIEHNNNKIEALEIYGHTYINATQAIIDKFPIRKLPESYSSVDVASLGGFNPECNEALKKIALDVIKFCAHGYTDVTLYDHMHEEVFTTKSGYDMVSYKHQYISRICEADIMVGSSIMSKSSIEHWSQKIAECAMAIQDNWQIVEDVEQTECIHPDVLYDYFNCKTFSGGFVTVGAPIRPLEPEQGDGGTDYPEFDMGCIFGHKLITTYKEDDVKCIPIPLERDPQERFPHLPKSENYQGVGIKYPNFVVSVKGQKGKIGAKKVEDKMNEELEILKQLTSGVFSNGPFLFKVVDYVKRVFKARMDDEKLLTTIAPIAKGKYGNVFRKVSKFEVIDHIALEDSEADDMYLVQTNFIGLEDINEEDLMKEETTQKMMRDEYMKREEYLARQFYKPNLRVSEPWGDSIDILSSIVYNFAKTYNYAKPVASALNVEELATLWEGLHIMDENYWDIKKAAQLKGVYFGGMDRPEEFACTYTMHAANWYMK